MRDAAVSVGSGLVVGVVLWLVFGHVLIAAVATGLVIGVVTAALAD